MTSTPRRATLEPMGLKRDLRLVGEYAAELRRQNQSPGTITKRHLYLGTWTRWIHAHHSTLARAEADDVNRFLDGRDIGPRTRYCWLSHLSCFYRWGMLVDRLPHDPTLRIRRPKLPKRHPRPIGSDDLAAAIELAGPTMRVWLLLMAYGGLRCDEVAGLHAEHLVDRPDGRMIHVHAGKGDKDRLVPLHPATAAAIRTAQLPTHGPLFRRPHGGRARGEWVSKQTSAYLSAIGVDATAHQLRHWFATWVLGGGADLRTVQELLGHASVTSTQIYTAVDTEAAHRIVAGLDARTTAAAT